MPVVSINDVSYTVPSGTRLGELLARETKYEMPCGGQGRCGKCKVTVRGAMNPLTEREKQCLSADEIAQGIRLACLTVTEGDCRIRIDGEKDAQIRILGKMPSIRLQPAFTAYGCAVDIGTTTLAACLYDAEGNMLAQASSRNPQAGRGADVISRMDAALGGAGRELSAAVCSAVDELLIQLAETAGISGREVDGLVITGNTVMLHLLTETSPEPLSHAPFAVERKFGETVETGVLGLTSVAPEAAVYLPPCISAFVGADLVTALLASGICREAGTQMLVDIGTNGEMALIRNGQLIVCSTAAGPAFEGAGISCGIQGRHGAIDRVFFQEGELKAHVIGEHAAEGICGSGIVDAIACLLESGQIDETGYMEEESILIAPTVALTQQDVRMIQLAKSAVHAGIRTLLHLADIDCGEVSGLLIAGGFGSYLNVENAGRIGLIPKELVPRVRVIGNAALSGAAMLLLNQEYRAVCERYAGDAKGIELSNDPFFSEEYMAQMMF